MSRLELIKYFTSFIIIATILLGGLVYHINTTQAAEQDSQDSANSCHEQEKDLLSRSSSSSYLINRHGKNKKNQCLVAISYVASEKSSDLIYQENEVPGYFINSQITQLLTVIKKE